jgi:formiminoglutamase
LAENETGFCFLGFCSDQGVKKNKGRPGAAKGPLAIRRELANLPCRFPKQVKLFDAGNIICTDECELEAGQQALAGAVEKVLELGLFPIVLGGGHELAFGHYNGILNSLLKQEQQPRIGVINFDAHFDLRPYSKSGNSGTMFRQIAHRCEEEELDFDYFCLGLQKYGNTISLFETADQLGAEYVLAKDITEFNIVRVIEKLNDFIDQTDYIYLTVCADVFSSAFAPGVSAAHPLGMDPELVLKLMKHILRKDKTISFDLAEVSPRFDMDNSTAHLAAIIIFALVDTLTAALHDRNAEEGEVDFD